MSVSSCFRCMQFNVFKMKTDDIFSAGNFRLLHRDMRIRNPPQAAVDRMLGSAMTRSALERANADMAAAASKVCTCTPTSSPPALLCLKFAPSLFAASPCLIPVV